MVFNQRLQLQADQLVQTHLQNSVRLFFRKAKLGRHGQGSFGAEFNAFRLPVHKAGLRHRSVLRSPQDLDHQIDHVAGFDQPLLDLLFLLLFFQKIRIFSGGHLKLELHAFSDNSF